MPESTPDKVHHDTIESPYRISWQRLLKIIIPIFILFLAIAYWFVGIYTPSKIVAPSTTTTPDFQESTPSSKPATDSDQKDETADWKTQQVTKYAFSFKYPEDWFSSLECEGLISKQIYILAEEESCENLKKETFSPENNLDYLEIQISNNKLDLNMEVSPGDGKAGTTKKEFITIGG